MDVSKVQGGVGIYYCHDLALDQRFERLERALEKRMDEGSDEAIYSNSSLDPMLSTVLPFEIMSRSLLLPYHHQPQRAKEPKPWNVFHSL
jgi:hypothetical protein